MTAVTTFDQLQVGAIWRSAGRTLSEFDLGQSCMSSADWHPIHADAVFAAGTPAGQRIFHGTYGLHVAMGVATQFPNLGDDVIAALGISQWRYLCPLFVGDTIHVEVQIVSKRITSDPGRGVVERQLKLIRHNDEVVQAGLVQTMVRRQRGET